MTETEFGDLLRRYRVAAGLTQEDLAERSGLSTRGISDLERGARGVPRKDTLDLLLRAIPLSSADRAALIAAAQRPSRPRQRESDTHSTLPAPLTPLIGRQGEITAAAILLLSPAVRLLTLTGAGGTGKTRLALALAGDVAGDFPGGVVFVSLAPLTDPSLVPSTIAEQLGVREAGGTQAPARLKSLIGQRRMLLILDNYEHVLPAAPLVAELLAACSELKVMTTSRAPLQVTGEHIYPVPPLRLPDPHRLPSLADLAQTEAVRLFVERVQAAWPNFALSESNAAAVAEIVRRLDGLPLALELAAPRVRVLYPAALLARLERRLPLLTGGARDLADRQRTLQDTIAWSYDLLTAPEQTLFRRLGVFSGGWTLEAAEEVAHVDGDPDLLEGMLSLVAKSLVQVEEQGETPRYRMLETIREFALDRLSERGDETAIRDRHAAFYLAFAESAELELGQTQQMRWRDDLAADRANLRAALTWFSEQDQIDAGLRLATALKSFWQMRGPFAEGSQWLSTFLARSARDSASPLRARALAAAGYFEHWQGHHQQALAFYEESRLLSEQLADPATAATALWGMASTAIDLGDPDHAERLLAESHALAESAGDIRGMVAAENLLGIVAYARGDFARAGAYFTETGELFRTLGDVVAVGDAIGDAGYVTVLVGDLRAAQRFLAESLALAVDLGAPMRIGWALMSLGHVAARQGDAAQAVRLLAATATIWESIGEEMRPRVRIEYDALLAEQRQRLGEDAFAAAWQRGQRSSVEEAVAEARTVLATMESLARPPSSRK